MKIIFLGTSSGTPTNSRNLSAIAVKMSNSKRWCLVDCGEGAQYRLLNSNLTLHNLQAIFITHVHGDHCYGLPGLLASATMAGRTDMLTVIGPDAVREYIDVTRKATQLRLSFELDFISIEEVSGLIHLDEFNVEAIELSHRVPSFAYGFYEKNLPRKLNHNKLMDDGIESGPIWGRIQKVEDVLLPNGSILKSQDYLIEARKPRKIIISGDNDAPDLLAESSESANVLVHEATHTEDISKKIGEKPQHSTAKTISQFAENNTIRNLILTHFSPRYRDKDNDDLSIKDIENEARKHFNGNLFLANDLDTFNLNQQGQLTRI